MGAGMLKMRKDILAFAFVGIVGVFFALLACGGGGGGGESPLVAATTTGTGIVTAPDAEGVQGTINEVINALGAGDIATIQTNFDSESWESGYKNILSSSALDRAGLASDLSNAELVFQNEDYALYRVAKVENGTLATFDIHLVKVDGKWKIYSM